MDPRVRPADDVGDGAAVRCPTTHVVAGLDPATHPASKKRTHSRAAGVDDRWIRGASPRMTLGGRGGCAPPHHVVAGLDPATHLASKKRQPLAGRAGCEAGWIRGSGPRMTSEVWRERAAPPAGPKREARLRV